MQILHRKGQTSKPKLAIAQGEQAWGEGHGGPCSAFVLLRRCPLLNSAWICWFAFDTALSCFFFLEFASVSGSCNLYFIEVSLCVHVSIGLRPSQELEPEGATTEAGECQAEADC